MQNEISSIPPTCYTGSDDLCCFNGQTICKDGTCDASTGVCTRTTTTTPRNAWEAAFDLSDDDSVEDHNDDTEASTPWSLLSH